MLVFLHQMGLLVDQLDQMDFQQQFQGLELELQVLIVLAMEALIQMILQMLVLIEAQILQDQRLIRLLNNMKYYQQGQELLEEMKKLHCIVLRYKLLQELKSFAQVQIPELEQAGELDLDLWHLVGTF